MHDRNLDPIPDLVIEPDGTIRGETPDGTLWLEGYRMVLPWPPASYRRTIHDARDDGLRVEDRR